MIEGSRQRLSGGSPSSTLVAGHSGPVPSDEVDRRAGYAQTHARSPEMTSTTSEFQTDGDQPTLQIRRGRGGELGGTPSPDTRVRSREQEVTPSMRMELRQKRRVIEEVAVYDSSTFYENQSPKRSRQRDDRSESGSIGLGRVQLCGSLWVILGDTECYVKCNCSLYLVNTC